MNIEQARSLRRDTILYVRETFVDGSGRTVDRPIDCRYHKCIGGHVVVQMYGNVLVTIYPEDLALSPEQILAALSTPKDPS